MLARVIALFLLALATAVSAACAPVATPGSTTASVTASPATSRPLQATNTPAPATALSSPTSRSGSSAMTVTAPAGVEKVVPPDPATVVDTMKQVGQYTVWLASDPNPPARGINRLEAVIADADGNSVNGLQVSFDLDMTNMSHGKNLVEAAPLGAGHYAGTVRYLMGGPWRVILRIRAPGQAELSERFVFTVGR